MAFEDVICYLGWWDCPRSGVALIGGKPNFFDCRFSEELDDYPNQYQVWPASTSSWPTRSKPALHLSAADQRVGRLDGPLLK
jgi:hypothetical protein